MGGVWALEKVIPSNDNVASTLTISKFSTLIVGLVLLLFGLMYLIKTGIANVQIPNWMTNYAYWAIPAIFILRAIGGFNYIGFFKKIKTIEFAKADSKIFSLLAFLYKYLFSVPIVFTGIAFISFLTANMLYLKKLKL